MRQLILICIFAAIAHADPDPVAASYDELLDTIADADHTKDVDQAAARYNDVAHAAEQWLAHAPATGRFTTRHDGAVDAKRLVVAIKALEARAEAAYDRYIEKLEAELHAITPGQRAIVLKRGRPQVVKTKPRLCWIYRDDTNEESYCWTKAGKIAEHTTTPIAQQAPPDEEPAPKPKSKPKKKPKRSFYAAATFASGECKYGECMKYGWSSETPEGTVITECKYQECMKYGWSTTYPGDVEVTTECKYQECMKYGWSTETPDGTIATECKYQECMKSGWTSTYPGDVEATTECKYQDCLTYGWSTDLSHKSITCECKYNECPKYGATCE